MAEVVLDSVGKVYVDGTRAVQDLNLDITDGEFLVLVGPSGCGKTTALRMVAGLEDISEGQVRIGEKVVNHVPSRDRDVAMVFQSYALYPHLSVRDNIGFGLQLRKLPKAEIARRVEEAARTLGLEDYLDRKPRNLSGGQRQRVAMGRAIVREPQALVGDPAREGRILRSSAELVEAMGSDVLVHFGIDAPAVVTDDTKELARDAGTDVLGGLPLGGHTRTVLVARFSPRTQVREGADVAAYVNTDRLHFFDPHTGLSIWAAGT